MTGRLRVAIVAPSMAILGGQAVQAERLLEGWRDDPRVEAWLVPINPAFPRGLHWAQRVKYLRTLVTQIVYWPLLFRELRRADVVHVFSASYSSFLLAPLPAIVVAKLLGRPVLVNYRSGEAPDHLRRSRLARRTLARVDRNVVPSRFLCDVFASFNLGAEVVPNVVDGERFAFRARTPLGPRLLSTRNFEALYNVACTLRAFRLVQDRHPNATLTLVGSGREDATLRRLASELDLTNVTFAGRVAPADIWRYYRDADIYVQTPDIDNMPSSVLEAFASGTPVVSTDAGGVPAIVTDRQDGLLAPCDDAQAVANCVLRLLDDSDLAARIAAAARAQCTRYTWSRVRRDWLAVYEDVRTGRLSKLARLWAVDRRELRFRSRVLMTRAARRAAGLLRTPGWRRRDLASRLVASWPALGPARRAVRAGDWNAAEKALVDHLRRRQPRFLLNPRERSALASAVTERFPGAVDDARRRGDALVDGGYDLLGYRGVRFDPAPSTSSRPPGECDVDWARDPVHDRRAADRWWSDVAYLDASNGDHKIIWELNRHQHWLALGRAFWLTGDERYRRRVIAELRSWLQQNPPLRGINWASMLELSLRALSWVWALHFFLDGSEDEPWVIDLLLALDRQMRHVEENLSCYFSPNTHLTGEAVALYVAGRVLPELRASQRWADTGRRILIEQAGIQIADDGGHAERSTHYHRYTLDFYALALAVARRTGDVSAARAFEPVVARLAHYAWAVADANGHLPRIGDDDAGSLLPICDNDVADIRPSLSVAAALLPGQVRAEDATEESLWVAGPTAADNAGKAPAQSEGETFFPETGVYVSRTRTGDHLVFDAGPHGFLNGGHAHADALSITLSVRWHQFLVDAGTGTYTMDAALRDWFRSTAAHNTLVLDDRSQADPDGPFHWRRATDARAVRCVSGEHFTYLEGEHDAYAPAVHRRAVASLDGALWLVADHVLDTREHGAAVHWHLDPEWRTEVCGRAIDVVHADGLRVAIASTARQVDMFRGDRHSGLGWCSPAYGRIVECTALRFSQRGRGPFSIVTAIGPLSPIACIEPLPVAGPPDAHGFAVRLARHDSVDVALFTTAPIGPGRSNERWRFGEFETDARFVHLQLSLDGRVRKVSMVDGTAVFDRRSGAVIEAEPAEEVAGQDLVT